MLLRNGSFGEPELTPQKGAIGMFSRNPMNGPDPLHMGRAAHAVVAAKVAPFVQDVLEGH